MTAKFRSIGLLVLAEIAVMSLWFMSSAVLPDMLREVELSAFRQAALASGVQIGFVVGALLIAISGLADRLDARLVFASCAVFACVANTLLGVAAIGGDFAILLRVLTGFFLAGVYPVGMKIAVGWGQKDRGLLVGLVVGALTIGSAAPHLIASFGGTDWRFVVSLTSLIGLAGGLLVLGTTVGPFDVRAKSFQIGAVKVAWSNKLIRYVYLGYLGHMWELYAMWAWLLTFLSLSFSLHLSGGEAQQLARLVTFFAIGLGGLATIAAGRFADQFGKAQTTIYAMTVSCLAALATAFSFEGPLVLTIVFAVLWGLSIIPDSAQFSALVADHSPSDLSGSLLTLQTALGFTLTSVTVQLTPLTATHIGWPLTVCIMALGPLFGIWAMRRYLFFAGQVRDE